jgi:hypothetical protein
MRRHSTDRPDEIAYADVAMAVLGPIMVLMFVFAVQAGTQDASEGCTDVSAAANESEFQTLVADLDRAVVAIRDENDELRELLGANDCKPDGDPPADPPSGQEAAARFAPLAELCGPTRKAVIEQSQEIDWTDLPEFFGEHAGLQDAVRICLAGTGQEPCRQLDASDREETADLLTSWQPEAKRDVKTLSKELDDRDCPNEAGGESWRAEPPSLVGVCPADKAAVAEQAGTDLDTLRRLASNRERLQSRLASCIEAEDRGKGPKEAENCRQLANDERRRAARRLDEWFDRLGREIQSLGKRDVLKQCEDSKPRAGEAPRVFDQIAGLRPVFENLSDLCPDDRTAVLDLAELEAAEVRDRTIAYARAMECRAKTREFTTERLKQVEFVECQPTIAWSQMDENQNQHFRRVVRTMQKRLEANPGINRIDIIGRTDLTWGGACLERLQLPKFDNTRVEFLPKVTVRAGPPQSQVDGDTRNMLLSTYRAIVYRKHLFEALAKAGLADLLRRRDVRIYAIGAGIDQPAFVTVPKGGDDPDLRRIDIRFVWENRDEGGD